MVRVAAMLCATAVLLAGCMASDNTIHEEVRTRLDSNPATKGLSIKVVHRVVHLSGPTETLDAQAAALSIARSVQDVKLVEDDMWLNNAALAKKVREALAADASVAAIPIEIEVRGDTVKLKSTETNATQRERIVQIASGVEGVGEVEDLMK